MTDIAIEDRSLFNRIAHKYAKKTLWLPHRMQRGYQILRALRPVVEKSNKKLVIADIGCGIGATAKYLGDTCAKYIGVDHSEKMIEMANQVNWESNFPVEFIASDVKASSLNIEKADVVLAVGALHHMTELDEVMNSVKRLAKPGATFVAIEPQRKIRLFRSLVLFERLLIRPTQVISIFFSYDELYDLCERNGLKNIELEYQGFFSKPFGQVILPVESVAQILSKLSVAIDSVLDDYMPSFLRPLSWDLIVRAEFPRE